MSPVVTGTLGTAMVSITPTGSAVAGTVSSPLSHSTVYSFGTPGGVQDVGVEQVSGRRRGAAPGRRLVEVLDRLDQADCRHCGRHDHEHGRQGCPARVA